MKGFLIILGCLCLWGCAIASQDKYEVKLDQWLGQAEENLVTKWGVPDKVYEVGNKKFLSFNSERNSYLAQTYNGCFPLGRPFEESAGNVVYQVVRNTCQTTFVIENKVVTNWSHRGDGCISE